MRRLNVPCWFSPAKRFTKPRAQKEPIRTVMKILWAWVSLFTLQKSGKIKPRVRRKVLKGLGILLNGGKNAEGNA
jgi:hypothetical protein